VDEVDLFIARYAKEYDFYDQAGRIVSQRLEAALKSEGIRAIVTYRAKNISRLEQKCRQRAAKRSGYVSVDEIFDDIVDLVGVRVALYFPAEREEVDRIIAKLFQLVSPKKSFPDPAKRRVGQRFSGYSAEHYRIKIKEQDLSEEEVRYALARIEIQVASVLMHAWAEVEHDLIYKPTDGNLSDAEYASLDQLNGIVLAGEMSLESLQKARAARVAASEDRIENHYDLAALLAGYAKRFIDRPISDAGMGRVDILFDLLSRLQIDTAEKLKLYLEALHGNIEVRPLAEQIVDELLAEDPSRYELYDSIRPEGHSFVTGRRSESSDAEAVGNFLKAWIELERVVNERTKEADKPRRLNPINYRLRDLGLLDRDSLNELDRLRRMRNDLVHGVDTPPSETLMQAASRINELITKIRNAEDPREEE